MDDFFANITTLDNQTLSEGLYQPTPPKLNLRPLPEHPSPTEAPTYQTASTEDALNAELATLRAQMLPFLKKHAPKLENHRSSQSLESFDWRIETAADQADFTGQVTDGGGDWETVTIPHFGAPMGRATTFYRTTVSFTADDLAIGSSFISFKGADYKAHLHLR